MWSLSHAIYHWIESSKKRGAEAPQRKERIVFSIPFRWSPKIPRHHKSQDRCSLPVPHHLRCNTSHPSSDPDTNRLFHGWGVRHRYRTGHHCTQHLWVTVLPPFHGFWKAQRSTRKGISIHLIKIRNYFRAPPNGRMQTNGTIRK